MRHLGFTVIELILVVGLLVGLAVLSTGWYSRFLTQNAVGNTAVLITGSLRKAQAYASSGRGDANWGVAYAGQTLTLYKGSAFTSRDPSWDETTIINNNISVSGMSDINFTQGLGLPSVVATITVSGNNTLKTIVLNSQGGISYD